MKLVLERVAYRDTYIIGKLYINGIYFCDTLEDKNRDLNKDGDLNDAGEGKVFGETAIPFGVYTVVMNMSTRFKRIMPLLLNVPHFSGIRIHSGSKAEHSHGCILVGVNDKKGRLSLSKDYETKLYALLNKEKSITIEIK